MAKARWLTALAQRKEFFLRFGATFAAIIGMVSAGIGITGYHFNIVSALALGALAVLVSLSIHARRWIVPQVIVDDIIGWDIDDNFYTVVHCPCDMKIAAQAGKLAQACFTTTFTIPPETYEQLRVKNPYILACMTDHRGEFLGYFDIIPVKESFASLFMRGTVTEAQITHEDVLSVDDMPACKYLFIGGLAVWHPDTHAGRRSASMLAWAALRYLERFYGGCSPTIFAVAATGTGEALLRRFKLNLLCAAVNRKDKYNLYSILLTQEEIARRLASLPDWSRLCLLDWVAGLTVPTNGRRKRPRLPKTKARERASPGAVAAQLR